MHAAAIPLLVALAGSTQQTVDAGRATTLRFTDTTAESGLAATMTSGGLPSQQILEVKGGGLALLDVDRDGDLDVFMPNGASLASPFRGPGARLFRNDSTRDALRFTDITAASGIDHVRWSFGATVGDIDADGDDDLFIACYGPDVVLRNNGDGTFADVSKAAGVQAPERDVEWSTGCAFADVDQDGDLDLYVVNYLAFDPTKPPPPARFKGVEVMAGPKGLPGQGDRLFLNDGTGVFTDVTTASGIGAAPPSFGLNLAILDFTGDGRVDIYVGNDSQKNFLFRQGAPKEVDGRMVPSFEEIGLRSGVATNMEGLEQATMGIAIGDIDGNGRPDLFTTNFSSDTNTLHLNLDGTFFDDRTSQYGLAAVSRPFCGWAAAFVDFDHDADEDLLVVNGHVYPQATRAVFDSDYEQRPLLMERRGRRFEAVTTAGAWTLEPRRDRTAVFADFDRDGDVDVLIGELNGPLRVIRNDHAKPDVPDWLVVELRDPRPGVGNRWAIGSMVEVRSVDADGTKRTQRRWMWGGGPFQSTLAPELHVGLPIGSTSIEVVATWPDGTTTTMRDVQPGRHLRIDRQPSTQ
jgi:hypothetical protein